jgi:hypothetical protein
LLSHLVAVHPPELGIIQRLKHIADQIPCGQAASKFWGTPGHNRLKAIAHEAAQKRSDKYG